MPFFSFQSFLFFFLLPIFFSTLSFIESETEEACVRVFQFLENQKKEKESWPVKKMTRQQKRKAIETIKNVMFFFLLARGFLFFSFHVLSLSLFFSYSFYSVISRT